MGSERLQNLRTLVRHHDEEITTGQHKEHDREGHGLSRAAKVPHLRGFSR
jgi:hypothetical protein